MSTEVMVKVDKAREWRGRAETIAGQKWLSLARSRVRAIHCQVDRASGAVGWNRYSRIDMTHVGATRLARRHDSVIGYRLSTSSV